MLNFSGKTVVITGGSGGIGLITASSYLKQGARVVLFDLNEDALAEAKKNLKGEVVTVQGDVTNTDDLDRLISIAGNIDIMVCLTGLCIHVTIADIEPQQIDKMFSVNVKGTILSVQAGARVMKPGSAIVLISSSAHLKPIPAGCVYGASKSAVRSFARGAASELMDRGIRVNSVCPGPIDTERMAGTALVPPEAKAKAAGMIPMKRLGEPQEIADAVLYLSSDEAGFITGAELSVCGGLTNL